MSPRNGLFAFLLLSVIACGGSTTAPAPDEPSGGGDVGGSDGSRDNGTDGTGGATTGGIGGEVAFPSMDAGYFTTTVPSENAGPDGVTVRVYHPATANRRFLEGAPIVINVRGGWGNNGLGPEEVNAETEAHGYVLVDVLLPGGKSADGAVSGGSYDYRGPNCVAAIRDAIRYAGGTLEDSDGNSLTDRVPFALADQIGMYGGSNGGNLAIVTLAEHGEELPDVKWVVTWESPIGDQYAAVELNGNAFYTPGSCSVTSCPWPRLERELRFDPDGTTNVQQTMFVGVLFLDSNHNGSHDPSELDFGRVLGPGDNPSSPKLYVSQELSATLDAHHATIFGANATPPWLASTSEVKSFWQSRDASLRIAEAATNFPSLMVMHLGSAKDHVQSLPDYPHARSHMSAWLVARHGFVRLNPDAAYMAALSGQDVSAFPDNDANTEVAWPNTVLAMIPEFVNGKKMDPFIATAGMLEMMDRVFFANSSPGIDTVLAPPLESD
ncbi:MAG TPA: hypothetical protein QGF35_04255 [Dehalococcoidia bacterium]|nr:hypothetical protein [Dehalococcoidia bacterium]